MQNLVLILILISSSAFGSDLEAILGGLNSKDPLAENCDPSLSKLESCALEVCGPPTNVPSASLTDENFKKNVLGGPAFDHGAEIETLKTELRTHLQNYETARAGIVKLNQTNKLRITTEDWNDFTWEIEATLAFSQYVKFTPQLNLPENSRLKVI